MVYSLFLGLLSCTPLQAKLDNTPKQKQIKNLEQEVIAILKQKCASCHDTTWMKTQNPQITPKARGKFDHVLNIEALRVNPKYILPGNPTDSYLVKKMKGSPGIKGEKMPPEDSDFHLENKEEERIIAWIRGLSKEKK